MVKKMTIISFFKFIFIYVFSFLDSDINAAMMTKFLPIYCPKRVGTKGSSLNDSDGNKIKGAKVKTI